MKSEFILLFILRYKLVWFPSQNFCGGSCKTRQLLGRFPVTSSPWSRHLPFLVALAYTCLLVTSSFFIMSGRQGWNDYVDVGVVANWRPCFWELYFVLSVTGGKLKPLKQAKTKEKEYDEVSFNVINCLICVKVRCRWSAYMIGPYTGWFGVSEEEKRGGEGMPASREFFATPEIPPVLRVVHSNFCRHWRTSRQKQEREP